MLLRAEIDIDALHTIFEDAFGRVFRGQVEDDDFNRLVVAARLPAEQIVILRAYAKYLRQIGFALSQAFIEATLTAHPDISRMLVELFTLRFDPSLPESGRSQVLAKIQQIDHALDGIENLDRCPSAESLLAATKRCSTRIATDSDSRFTVSSRTSAVFTAPAGRGGCTACGKTISSDD